MYLSVLLYYFQLADALGIDNQAVEDFAVNDERVSLQGRRIEGWGRSHQEFHPLSICSNL